MDGLGIRINAVRNVRLASSPVPHIGVLRCDSSCFVVQEELNEHVAPGEEVLWAKISQHARCDLEFERAEVKAAFVNGNNFLHNEAGLDLVFPLSVVTPSFLTQVASLFAQLSCEISNNHQLALSFSSFLRNSPPEAFEPQRTKAELTELLENRGAFLLQI